MPFFKKWRCLIVFSSVLLAACSIPQKYSLPMAPKKAKKKSLGIKKKNQALQIKPVEKYNIALKNASVQDFLKALATKTNENIIVDPNLINYITLTLKNATLSDIFQAIHDNYHYEFIKTSYGYKVTPKALETQIFSLHYLNMTRQGNAETSINSTHISNEGRQDSTQSVRASSITTNTHNNFWLSLKNNLIKISGDNKNIIVNPQSGSIVVSAYPDTLKIIQQYLTQLQNQLNSEVSLEAKIIEVTLNKQTQTGIDWSGFGMKQIGSLPNVSSLGLSNIFSASVRWKNHFNVFLRQLKQQGNVHVLSSPSIATLNNQKALIKIGTDNFYVTGVNSSIENSGAESTTSQDIDLTPFFSGVALDVTPEIQNSNNLILHIHPIISDVSENTKKFVVSGKEQDLPLAANNIREADTIVHAHSDQIIVIGGLMENKHVIQEGGIPLLDRIPILKYVFSRKNDSQKKTELVILLQAHILKN